MIELVLMNQEQYEAFRDQSAADYAAEKVLAGTWDAADAQRLAQESFAKYLPQGKDTPGAYIYHIVEVASEQIIGYIWLHISDAPAGKQAFLYDILIYEAHQGKGYGQATMQALDQVAKQEGAVKIGLHVFGHNLKALHVYEKAGYQITDYQMSKTLNV
ncbi:GNAT family N-acetyltransferase [Paenibacillus sp. PsM32]|uniref:GNAT family N-acetyltransferase n=1 Tax=Paenibacillus sp. PsM32 TaxID=3030536 RepID=UPI00263B76E7|nr:GNAT family N-acetyltransferase [Paenibacillus sp. PsM32]MDN4618829.1 GNAT family N-acetyltransferase [Paenibacillus sp. PsM32]